MRKFIFMALMVLCQLIFAQVITSEVQVSAVTNTKIQVNGINQLIVNSSGVNIPNNLTVGSQITADNLSANTSINAKEMSSGMRKNDGFWSIKGALNSPKDNTWKNIHTFESNEHGLYAISANLAWTSGGAAMIVFIGGNGLEEANWSREMSKAEQSNYFIRMSGLNVQIKNNNFPSNTLWSITKLSRY